MRRFTFPRDSYYPPESDVTEHSDAAALIARYTREGPHGIRYCVAAFGGKRSKPDLHYVYATEQAREDRIASWLDGQRARIEDRKQRQKSRSAPHRLTVGQIFYSSWGYDQTNVDFYEIVDVPSKCYLTVRKLLSAQVGDSGPSESVVPACGPDRFTGEPMRVRCGAAHSIKVSSCAKAYLWDGRPKHQTGWGYGH